MYMLATLLIALGRLCCSYCGQYRELLTYYCWGALLPLIAHMLTLLLTACTCNCIKLHQISEGTMCLHAYAEISELCVCV